MRQELSRARQPAHLRPPRRTGGRLPGGSAILISVTFSEPVSLLGPTPQLDRASAVGDCCKPQDHVLKDDR
jgi:hypothetical protein